MASPTGVLFTRPPSTQGPTASSVTGPNANGNAADAAAAWKMRSRLARLSRSGPSKRSTCSNVVRPFPTPASGVTTIRSATCCGGVDPRIGHSALRRSTMRRVPEKPRRCTRFERSRSKTCQRSAFSSQSSATLTAAPTGSPARTPAASIVALSAPELVPTSLRIGVLAPWSFLVSSRSAPAANAPFATAPPMTIAAPSAMSSSQPGRRSRYGCERRPVHARHGALPWKDD